MKIGEKFHLLGLLVITISVGLRAQQQPGHRETFSCDRWANPRMVTNHPLSAWSGGLDFDFQMVPARQAEWQLHYSAANIWWPTVHSYLPSDPELRRQFAAMPFFDRGARYPVAEHQGPTRSVSADGVLRAFHLQHTRPAGPHSEWFVGFTSLLLDGGRQPYSWLTNDGVIEWIHDSFTSSSDPFARREFAFDLASIDYEDEQGSRAKVRKGEWLPAYVTVAYRYFIPTFSEKVQLTALGQLAFNTARFNRSLDVAGGLSATLAFWQSSRHRFIWGNGLGLSAPQVWKNNHAILWTSRRLLYEWESELLFQRQGRDQRGWAIGLGYSLQSATFSAEEKQYLVITGNRPTSHWHYGATSKYSAARGVYFIFQYRFRKIAFYTYLMEDIPVHNGPDAQTGLGLRWLGARR